MQRSFIWIGAILAMSLCLGCAASSPKGEPLTRPRGEPTFLVMDLLPQGVAIGDVSTDRAWLWLRTGGPAIVQIEWAPLSVWEQVSQPTVAVATVTRTGRLTTTAETDYTMTLPLDRLRPGTTYRYHVLVGPVDSGSEPPVLKLAARGEFTSLPNDKTSVPVTFAWSGDLGGQGRCRQGVSGYPIFDLIRRQKLDFFLFLGDTIYADNACPSPPNEPGADFVANTLPTYRARHLYQRGAEALRRFLRAVPVYVIWDDHEVRDNFSGPFDEQMPAGRQALREYWPIARHADDPHRLYRTVRYGAELELFILDTRQYRSRNEDPDGPEKTMLGSAQLQWLLEGLRTSTATWKVLVTSVPLSVEKGRGGNDGWSRVSDGTGFERERGEIVKAILQQKIKNVVFLAGDVHWVQANAYDPDQDGVVDFHEYMVGPLSARPGRLTAASEGLHPTRLINEAGYQNFGLIRVTKDTFEVTVIDDAGEKRFSHLVQAR